MKNASKKYLNGTNDDTSEALKELTMHIGQHSLNLLSKCQLLTTLEQNSRGLEIICFKMQL